MTFLVLIFFIFTSNIFATSDSDFHTERSKIVISAKRKNQTGKELTTVKLKGSLKSVLL